MSMELVNLCQPPLETTLIGVIRGAADYYGTDVSDPTLFGGSGHAFLINIHEELCPSGPYVWNASRSFDLVRELGFDIGILGFFSPASSTDARGEIEATLRAALDAGIPCSLMNMEHQLITGYDDTGFVTAGPWPQNEFPPRHLTFGTWCELGGDYHVTFYTHRRVDPADRSKRVRGSLAYAVELFGGPNEYAAPGYGIGPDAYDNWLAAVDEHGASHGNWWNAVVWAECRRNAGKYMSEIAAWYPALAPCANELAKAYAAIAESLYRAADVKLPSERKKEVLLDLKQRELTAIAGVGEMLELV